MSGIKGLDSHSYISVIGCALEYRYIEVMHSSFQILIAVSTSLWGGSCGGDAVWLFIFPDTEAGQYFPPRFASPDYKSLCQGGVGGCSPVL